jgi:hypothetical protein
MDEVTFPADFSRGEVTVSAVCSYPGCESTDVSPVWDQSVTPGEWTGLCPEHDGCDHAEDRERAQERMGDQLSAPLTEEEIGWLDA